ncbi:hypothetical protein DFJ74DRAFT_674956 [Hyaloraphidium curvatum]|nr:hypothetical protein DFJ74DRAFT_674956 [Hyaloraphidium curvatum]
MRCPEEIPPETRGLDRPAAPLRTEGSRTTARIAMRRASSAPDSLWPRDEKFVQALVPLSPLSADGRRERGAAGTAPGPAPAPLLPISRSRSAAAIPLDFVAADWARAPPPADPAARAAPFVLSGSSRTMAIGPGYRNLDSEDESESDESDGSGTESLDGPGARRLAAHVFDPSAPRPRLVGRRFSRSTGDILSPSSTSLAHRSVGQPLLDGHRTFPPLAAAPPSFASTARLSVPWHVEYLRNALLSSQAGRARELGDGPTPACDSETQPGSAWDVGAEAWRERTDFLRPSTSYIIHKPPRTERRDSNLRSISVPPTDGSKMPESKRSWVAGWLQGEDDGGGGVHWPGVDG